jgi:hypothetical protein
MFCGLLGVMGLAFGAWIRSGVGVICGILFLMIPLARWFVCRRLSRLMAAVQRGEISESDIEK